MNSAEFPHSEIPGSKDVCSSPRLIAAYHVFHRLPVPRHSPCALYSLTVVYLSINISLFRFSICQRDFKLPFYRQQPLGEIIDLIKNQEFYLSLKSHFAVLYSVFKVHPSFGRLPASLTRCGVHPVDDSTIDERGYAHKNSLREGLVFVRKPSGLRPCIRFWVTQRTG